MTLHCSSSLREFIYKLSTKHETKSVEGSLQKTIAVAVIGKVMSTGRDQIMLESEGEWLSTYSKSVTILEKKRCRHTDSQKD